MYLPQQQENPQSPAPEVVGDLEDGHEIQAPEEHGLCTTHKYYTQVQGQLTLCDKKNSVILLCGQQKDC